MNYHIFGTKKQGKYLYDSNTNTIHPLPENVSQELVERVYACESEAEILKLAEEDSTLQPLMRYFCIWRNKTDAFRNYSNDKVFTLDSVDKAEESQIVSGLACDLILILTEQCNMRCAYCVYEEGLYPNRRDHESNHMQLEIARKAIDLYLGINARDKVRAFKKRALNIVFYGGEAFLNWPVVKESIKYVKGRYEGNFELHLGITTNLTLLQEEWLPYLRDNDVFINVSIDGPKEEHDRYRRLKDGKPSFELIQGKLEMIRRFDIEYYNKYLRSYATINGNSDFVKVSEYFDTGEVPSLRLVSMLKDLDNSAFHVRYPYDKKRYMESALALWDDYVKRCIEGAHFYQGDAQYAFHHEYMSGFYNAAHYMKHDKSWYTGSCAPGRKLAVAPNGNIYICERVAADRAVGHVDSGLDENKLLSYFNDFFKISDACTECWARNRCTICPAEVDSCYDFDFTGRCEGLRRIVSDSMSRLYSLLEEKPELFEDEYEYY